MTLLKWALIFALIALIAGLFGFTGIAGASAGIAKFLFYLFVAIVVLFLILGLFVFAVLAKLWPVLNHPAYGALISLASVLIVLFRRPNGSLATRRDKV